MYDHEQVSACIWPKESITLCCFTSLCSTKQVYMTSTYTSFSRICNYNSFSHAATWFENYTSHKNNLNKKLYMISLEYCSLRLSLILDLAWAVTQLLFELILQIELTKSSHMSGHTVQFLVLMLFLKQPYLGIYLKGLLHYVVALF